MNIREITRRALPLMSANDRAEASELLSSLRDNPPEEAAQAWERDLLPVRNAIVAALRAGNAESLRGLRALLPHLLEEANVAPEFGDVLAHQVGAAFLEGMELAENPPEENK